MRSGTAVHSQIEHALQNDEPPTDPRAVAAVSFFRDISGGQPWAVEQAYGMERGRSARCLGVGRDSYSSMPGGVLFGTADVLVKTGPNEFMVRDWKTGSGRAAEKAGPQLRLLGALVLSAHGGARCTLFADHLTDDGRVVPHGHGSIDAMDAEDLTDRLLAIDPAPIPFPGQHCTDHYCPLVGQCPAYQTAGALIPVEQMLPRNPLVCGIETDADLAAAIPLLDLVEARVDHLRKAARARIETAHGGAFRLPDGRVYRKSEGSRQYANGDQALALAERLGASKEELAQCVRVTKFPVWRMSKA